MLFDKISAIITSDNDEDFEIKQKGNQIIIFLEGKQFRDKGNIFIEDNCITYKENNIVYNYYSHDTYDLLHRIDCMINEWIMCNSPRSDKVFKNFFL